jgi:hypothetical protein
LRTVTLLLMLGCVAFGQDSASKQEKDSAVLKAMRDFSFVLCVKQLNESGKPFATNLDHTSHVKSLRTANPFSSNC